jgi:hypothetical protein
MVAPEHPPTAIGDMPSAVDVLAPYIVPAGGEMNIMQSLTAVLLTARARYALMPPPPRLSSTVEPSLRG